MPREHTKQTPATQRSLSVELSPSSHTVLSGLVGVVHWPVNGLQTPSRWHCEMAEQSLPSQRGVPLQVPTKEEMKMR